MASGLTGAHALVKETGLFLPPGLVIVACRLQHSQWAYLRAIKIAVAEALALQSQ